MSSGLKLAIIVFLLTLVVVVINPKMHKGVEISSSSNVVLKTDDNNIKTQDIKLSNNENFKNTNTSLKNIDNLNSTDISITDKDVIDYEKNLMAEYRRRKALANKQAHNTKKNQPQIVLDPNYKKTITNDLIISSADNIKIQETDITPKNINIEIEEPEPVVVNNDYKPPISKKTRTRYEETIVWNKWKSDLHNSIHNDIAYLIPDNMPMGALYKYSFIIDKNGKVSDVNVKILFPGLSLDGNGDRALQEGIIAFKKAIYSCSKRHFKGFPKGSQREYVKLELVVQMGFVNVYTNPGDFNDLEKVFGFR